MAVILGHDVDIVQLSTIAGPVMVAMVTGWWAWRARKPDAIAAFQAQLNTGFKIISDNQAAEQQARIAERAAWQAERKELLEEIHVLRAEVKELRREVAEQGDHIVVLERTLREGGIAPPKRER